VPSSIFSTYSTGENRVTASILAVLRSLSLGRIERLLGALMEQSEFELVRFVNQVSKGGEGIPDAMIASSCLILIETKTTRNAVNVEQLRRHLDRFKPVTEQTTQVLLVLTPDDQRPSALEALKDNRATWASFSALHQAIDELATDKKEVISEREFFLLRELQAMLAEEELLGLANDVLVVPARSAWPRYKSDHAYICQANRPFQTVKWMAFYAEGKIQPLVPRILHTWNKVYFKRGLNPDWLGQLVERQLDEKVRIEEFVAEQKVLQLTGPDHPDTVKLETAIINDLLSESGRPVAFTQNQRYVSLDRLKKAKTTSQLVGD
jgi:hypothetical protein